MEELLLIHDSRTPPFPNPEINEKDTVKFDLEKNEVIEW
jgi:hypothetical protein